jgi:hypothetical protein
MDVMRRCPACEAACHPTQGAARRAGRAAAGGRGLRVRRCPDGQGWHLVPARPARRRRAVTRQHADSRPVVRRLLAGRHRGAW